MSPKTPSPSDQTARQAGLAGVIASLAAIDEFTSLFIGLFPAYSYHLPENSSYYYLEMKFVKTLTPALVIQLIDNTGIIYSKLILCALVHRIKKQKKPPDLSTAFSLS
jgi:hypothetical protein